MSYSFTVVSLVIDILVYVTMLSLGIYFIYKGDVVQRFHLMRTTFIDNILYTNLFQGNLLSKTVHDFWWLSTSKNLTRQRKIFLECSLKLKINWITPAPLRNSTTVTTLTQVKNLLHVTFVTKNSIIKVILKHTNLLIQVIIMTALDFHSLSHGLNIK